MWISLSELLSKREAVKEMDIPIELSSFQLSDRTYQFLEKVPVKITLTSLKNHSVLIEAKSKVVLEVPCDRCLKDTAVPIVIDMSREFDFSKEEQRLTDFYEAAFIEGTTLDVDKLVMEELILGLPMKVLCRQDCKGICVKCGALLNESECRCDRAVLDPRMSVIRDIFNNFKEV